MSLVFWFLVAFGVAFVFGHSKISLPFRIVLGGQEGHAPAVPVLGPLVVALLECCGCFGWWLGLTAAIFWPALVPFELALWQRALMLAFATSGTNLLLGRFAGMV